MTSFDVVGNHSTWSINLTNDICLDIDTDIGKLHVVYYVVIGVLVSGYPKLTSIDTCNSNKSAHIMFVYINLWDVGCSIAQ